MKSRKVNRFLAILGACAMVVTSTPMSVNAAESVSNNATPTASATVSPEASPQVEDEEVDANAAATPSATPDGAVVDGEDSGETKTDPAAGSGDEVEGEDVTGAEDGEEPTEDSEDAVDGETGEDKVTDETKPLSPIQQATQMAQQNAANAAPTAGDVTADTETQAEAGTGEVGSVVPGAETAKIEADAESGLNAYHVVGSELTQTDGGDGTILVTGFTPSLSQSYDLIVLPGTINGKSVKYGTDILSTISGLRKGVILESGAELVTSTANLNITYVRFESGAKTTLCNSVFKGWEQLKSVIGYGEALVAGGASDVSFDSTFSGCKRLTNVALNLSGLTVSFNHTFDFIDNIESISVKGCNVESVSYLNSLEYDTRYINMSSNFANRTVTFSDVTFPTNDSDYLDHAFTNMPGSIIFNNCKAGDSALINFNSAYAGSSMYNYDSTYDAASNISLEPGAGADYNTKAPELDVRITGASAYSTKSMFEGSQLINVDLTNVITADTVAVDKMFKGATLASVKGIDSWRLGAATADEMFANTRVYFGPNAYLTKTLIPSIKKLGWSGVTSANNLFSFVYKADCPIDYSGMDLSGVSDLRVSTLSNYDFIAPAKNPQNFVFEQDTVYVLNAGSNMGGKALDPVAVTGGKVSGSDIPTNVHVYTDIATISVTDVSADNEVSTAVVPGYKLSDYLGTKVAYYQDRSLTQPVATDLVVSSGDKVSVYCQLVADEVDRDVVDGAEVDFGDDLEKVDITLEDGSTDKLQGGTADMYIKIADSKAPTNGMVVPSQGQKFAKSAFFNIDLIATIGTTEKKVTEMSQKATIVLPLPDDYVSGDVLVLNYHDGFNAAPIVLNTTVDKSAKTVTFQTDKFSPYVELYDDSVETDTVAVGIKWEGDVKDTSGRTDITIVDTVTYQNGSTLDVSGTYTKDTNKDTGVITLTYPKTLGGSAFKSHSFTPARDVDVDNYSVKFDERTYTYTLTYMGSATKETVNFTLDFSNLTDSDWTEHVNSINASSSGKSIITVSWKYDDNSEGLALGDYKPTLNNKVYTIPVEIEMKKLNGANFKEYTELKAYTFCKTPYEAVSDIDNRKVTFNPTATESNETTKYNFAVKVVDNSNASGKRPEKMVIDFTATYGQYTRSRAVEVNLKGMTGNTTNANVTFPNTVGGVAMTKLGATTSTATNIGYSSTWDQTKMLFKYTLAGASDTEPDPGVTIDPVDVFITFSGDPATERPNKVTLTLVDSNNQNAVTKEVNTAFAAGINSYKDSVNRLVNDTYHISAVSGIDATKYDVKYSGLTVTATYKATTSTVSSTKRVTVNMDDNNNEDGLRPKSIKVTIANKDGSDTVVSDITLGDSNSTTFDIQVKNGNEDYTVKSVSGMPDSYEVSMSGLTITCKHTVQKVTKTYKVEWSGDGDNADKTRPSSVQLTIKNSSSTVKTATVSADTNWSANVELNKLIKGVEASYTVEGADVTNYSKSVSGDTITYKFTGTLSKDAAAIEAGKTGTNGTDGVNGEATELSYDIANFDWIDYANKYPDLKAAYGYNKEALYAHYIRYGIGEGRVATFTGKYATVNEDVLKAYFPDDYKYKTDLNSVNEEYLIGKDKNTSSSSSSASSSGNKVTVDEDGNIHTTVKNEDGTTTETVMDKDGNIISVSTYKTGDLRIEDMSTWFVVLGVLLLAIAGIIVCVVVKDDKKKKSVLRMIS